MLNSINEMLDDLSLFFSIVQAGSLNKAAQRENIPAATLTRRLQKLEEKLQCKLLHRSTRGLTLTQEGELYYERCQPLFASMRQVVEELHHNITAPSGKVSLLAPINLANTMLADFWAEFLLQYPQIDLTLHLDNRNDDLLTQGADLALRVGKQNNSSLIQKRLTSVPTCIVASPDYVSKNTAIHHPDDLYQHDWLIAQPLSRFTMQKNKEQYVISVDKKRLQVNEINLCFSLAKKGIGLSYIPQSHCEIALENKELIKVLPDWETPIRDIYVVWQAQKQLPARARVLVDALIKFYLV